MNFRCFYLSKIKYLDALQIQKSLVEWNMKKKDIAQPTLLLLEHFPVYTIGVRSFLYSELEKKSLGNLGADFVRTDRGGLITFHGPGQLVVYPIVNLSKLKLGVRKYVNHLEEVIINVCSKFGISANCSPHTGVWVGDDKICAMGICVTQSITSHGLALNCNTDLDWFNHIVPCGIHGKGVTSLSKCLNKRTTVHDVIPFFLNAFSEIFGVNCNNLHRFDEKTSHDKKVQYMIDSDVPLNRESV